MYNLLKYLPRNQLSHFVGVLAHWRGPRFLVSILIRAFAWFYHIDLKECEKPVQEYPSLGDFFVRRLKSGSRPIAPSWAVHPADSRITQFGNLVGGVALIQAKGKNYRVSDLTADNDWSKKYESGCFITYYLCPTDYHRVHSPVDGVITRVSYIPGHLWPVNKWSVDNIDNLFCVNERMIVEIATELGMVAVVFVGATNVGQIRLSFDENFRGNSGLPRRKKEYFPPLEIKKGAELGLFRMGSTVILLFSGEYNQEWNGKMQLGPTVKVGQALTSS